MSFFLLHSTIFRGYVLTTYLGVILFIGYSTTTQDTKMAGTQGISVKMSLTTASVCLALLLVRPDGVDAQSRCDSGRYLWSGQMGYIKACLSNTGGVKVKTALTLQIAGPNAQAREISDFMNVMMEFNIPTEEGGANIMVDNDLESIRSINMYLDGSQVAVTGVQIRNKCKLECVASSGAGAYISNKAVSSAMYTAARSTIKFKAEVHDQALLFSKVMRVAPTVYPKEKCTASQYVDPSKPYVEFDEGPSDNSITDPESPDRDGLLKLQMRFPVLQLDKEDWMTISQALKYQYDEYGTEDIAGGLGGLNGTNSTEGEDGAAGALAADGDAAGADGLTRRRLLLETLGEKYQPSVYVPHAELPADELLRLHERHSSMLKERASFFGGADPFMTQAHARRLNTNPFLGDEQLNAARLAVNRKAKQLHEEAIRQGESQLTLKSTVKWMKANGFGALDIRNWWWAATEVFWLGVKGVNYIVAMDLKSMRKKTRDQLEDIADDVDEQSGNAVKTFRAKHPKDVDEVISAANVAFNPYAGERAESETKFEAFDPQSGELQIEIADLRMLSKNFVALWKAQHPVTARRRLREAGVLAHAAKRNSVEEDVKDRRRRLRWAEKEKLTVAEDLEGLTDEDIDQHLTEAEVSRIAYTTEELYGYADTEHYLKTGASMPVLSYTNHNIRKLKNFFSAKKTEQEAAARDSLAANTAAGPGGVDAALRRRAEEAQKAEEAHALAAKSDPNHGVRAERARVANVAAEFVVKSRAERLLSASPEVQVQHSGVHGDGEMKTVTSEYIEKIQRKLSAELVESRKYGMVSKLAGYLRSFVDNELGLDSKALLGEDPARAGSVVEVHADGMRRRLSWEERHFLRELRHLSPEEVDRQVAHLQVDFERYKAMFDRAVKYQTRHAVAEKAHGLDFFEEQQAMAAHANSVATGAGNKRALAAVNPATGKLPVAPRAPAASSQSRRRLSYCITCSEGAEQPFDVQIAPGPVTFSGTGVDIFDMLMAYFPIRFQGWNLKGLECRGWDNMRIMLLSHYHCQKFGCELSIYGPQWHRQDELMDVVEDAAAKTGVPYKGHNLVADLAFMLGGTFGLIACVYYGIIAYSSLKYHRAMIAAEKQARKKQMTVLDNDEQEIQHAELEYRLHLTNRPKIWKRGENAFSRLVGSKNKTGRKQGKLK